MKESRFSPFIPKSWVCFREYQKGFFLKDLVAGITVGVVALPLAMAFAIASGTTPERGIYTAIIAGFLISLLGGSKVVIGGPTGAFIVIVYGIILRQGYAGLAIATIIAGVILIFLGIAKVGGWIKLVPYPLVTGFTSGIAVVIFSSQLKDFFGLTLEAVPANFIEQAIYYYRAFPSLDPVTTIVSSATLLVIIAIRLWAPSIPWGITAIVIATGVCSVFSIPVETIQTKFGEIPRSLPIPTLPSFEGTLEQIHTLIPDAMVIAFLAGIESLLCAVVADSMMGGRHKPNCELIAQGVANIVSIIFGGIPATGAIARTATNIKSGAKTPLAGIIHAVTLLLILVFLAPLASKIPLPALSSVLVMVAWNMSEAHHFRRLFYAPPADVAILLTTFILTVLVDLTVAVEVGMVMAAFVFMKRMSDMPKEAIVQLSHETTEEERAFEPIEGVELYEINGPFFFGVADTVKTALTRIAPAPKVYILHLEHVPFIDATGMHALKEMFYRSQSQGTTLLLSGIQPHVLETLSKFGIEKLFGPQALYRTKKEAINQAKRHIGKSL